MTCPVKRLSQAVFNVETTPGTVNAGTATTTKISNPNLSLEGQRLPRDIAGASLSNWISDTGARSATLTFDLELEGSGTAGTAPGQGIVLRAMGFQHVDGASDNVYTVTSTLDADGGTEATEYPVVTIGYYEAGIRYLLVGCVGTGQLSLDAGGKIMISCTFQGKVGTIAAGAAYTETYDNTASPAVLSAAFSYASTSAAFRRLEIDFGNVVELQEDGNDSTGFDHACITDRNMVGQLFVPSMISTLDWWTLAQAAGGSGALSIAAGATAGNIVTITAPAVQLSLPSGGSAGGRAEQAIPLRFCRVLDAGDDELVITYT